MSTTKTVTKKNSAPNTSREDVEAYLKLLLRNANKEGYLSRHIGDLAAMFNINSEINRSLHKHQVYVGVAKQPKRITYTEVSDELVDMVFNSHKERYLVPDKSSENESNIEKYLKNQSFVIDEMHLKIKKQASLIAEMYEVIMSLK